MNGPDEVPPEAGQSPIPEGHVRLFHQTPLEHVPSIREHGISTDHAHDASGKGVVWASHGTQFYGDQSSGATVEFHVPYKELQGGGGQSPRRGDAQEDYEKSAHHTVVLGRTIRPDEISAIHEPWHDRYRYLSGDREAVRSGEYDHALDLPEYTKAINLIKREANVETIGRKRAAYLGAVGVGPKYALYHQGLKETSAPPDVDTLRGTVCPVCSSEDSFMSGRCSVCSAPKPPRNYMEPDTSRASQIERVQEGDPSQVGEGIDPDDPDDVGEDDGGIIDPTDPAMGDDAPDDLEGLDPDADTGDSDLICPVCDSTFPTAEDDPDPHLVGAADTIPLDQDPVDQMQPETEDDLSETAYSTGDTCPVCGDGELIPDDEVTNDGMEDEEYPEEEEDPTDEAPVRGRTAAAGELFPYESSSHQHGDGEGNFTPEREELHHKIINSALGSSKPSTSQPEATFLGGGSGSGKTTALAGHVKGAVISSDDFKTQLPEYNKLVENGEGGRAAPYVHEESSVLAKRTVKEAQKRGADYTLDSVGDTSTESMRKSIGTARDAGYKVHGAYVTIPTEEAIRRADSRAERTGRHVPHDLIKAKHAEVSRVFKDLIDNDDFDSAHLYDNSGKTPVRVGHKPEGGKWTVERPDLWDSFLKKGAKMEHESRRTALVGKMMTEGQAAEVSARDIGLGVPFGESSVPDEHRGLFENIKRQSKEIADAGGVVEIPNDIKDGPE